MFKPISSRVPPLLAGASTSCPPDIIHVMNAPRSSPFLLLFSFCGIIVNANRRTNGVGLGTRLHLNYTNGTHGYSQCTCSFSWSDICCFPPAHTHRWGSYACVLCNNLHGGGETLCNTTTIVQITYCCLGKKFREQLLDLLQGICCFLLMLQ